MKNNKATFVMMKNNDKATLNIDPELHRQLKIEAATRAVKLSEFAEQLLKEGLKANGLSK